MLVFLLFIAYIDTATNFKIPVPNAGSPFPPHTDFLKLGESSFRGENYKVLKPTTHEIKDHFLETMTRHNQNVNDTGKIFIDKNGFRHTWTGFEEEKKYLKETGQKLPPDVKEQLLSKLNVLRDGSSNPPSGGSGDFIKTSFYCPFFGIMTMLTQA